MEYSGKWGQSLDAINHLKTAFYIKLAELLVQKHAVRSFPYKEYLIVKLVSFYSVCPYTQFFFFLAYFSLHNRWVCSFLQFFLTLINSTFICPLYCPHSRFPTFLWKNLQKPNFQSRIIVFEREARRNVLQIIHQARAEFPWFMHNSFIWV